MNNPASSPFSLPRQQKRTQTNDVTHPSFPALVNKEDAGQIARDYQQQCGAHHLFLTTILSMSSDELICHALDPDRDSDLGNLTTALSVTLDSLDHFKMGADMAHEALRRIVVVDAYARSIDDDAPCQPRQEGEA